MAKKSARSKGYIKTQKKKPYMSKKELTIAAIAACIFIVALVVALIVNRDTSIKSKNGQLQIDGENNLILNAGTGYQPRYFKLGQLEEIKGYTMTKDPMDSNGNVNRYIYTPNAESPIDSISVRTYALDAKTYAASSEESYTQDPDMVSDGLRDTEDDGRAVQYLTFRHIPSDTVDPDNVLSTALEDLVEEARQEGAELDEEALKEAVEASEAAPVLVQALHGYVDAGENRLIYILIRNDVESVEEYVDDEIFVDALNQVLGALSYEER